VNNNARLGVNDFDLWGRARGLMRADGSFGLPTEGSMVSFMIWLADTKGYSPTVIKRRLRGVGAWMKEATGRDPRMGANGVELPALAAIMKGIAKKRTTAKKPRDPVTVDRLRKFTQRIDAAGLNVEDARMAKACLWMGVLGLFRVGEMTCRAQTGVHKFDPAVNATRADIEVFRDGQGSLTKMTFLLRQSKTDVNGEGTKVDIMATGGSFCAVAFMDAYLRATATRSAEGPLFALSNGKSLTRARLQSIIKELATACGFDASRFTSHSLRQGGAVTLHAAGYPIEHIKLAGRWSSSCVEIYLGLTTAVKQQMARDMVAIAPLDHLASPTTWGRLRDEMMQ